MHIIYNFLELTGFLQGLSVQNNLLLCQRAEAISTSTEKRTVFLKCLRIEVQDYNSKAAANKTVGWWAYLQEIWTVAVSLITGI